jgi:hypothetical protein
VEDLGSFCKNCEHSFKLHEQSAMDIWYCDFEDRYGEFCTCNYFEPKKVVEVGSNDLEVQYGDESYRWN